MTQEEKQLLLKDLCARMPFYCGGVIVQYLDKYQRKRIGWLASIWRDGGGINIASIPVWEKDSRLCYLNDFDETHGYEEAAALDYIKPYLRPMSSMTKEEFDEYMQFIKHSWEGIDKEEDDYYIKVKDRDVYTDWLLEHHLDYRGLIPMGLALEAPEEMYKTE